MPDLAAISDRALIGGCALGGSFVHRAAGPTEQPSRAELVGGRPRGSVAWEPAYAPSTRWTELRAMPRLLAIAAGPSSALSCLICAASTSALPFKAEIPCHQDHAREG
jgi:hypothetical protein